jgi:hypothetical protein
MFGFRSLPKTLALVAITLSASALHAQDGLSDAMACAKYASNTGSTFLGPSLATADFNNDHHPDGALLLRDRNSFRIEVHFRFHQVSEITFASSLPQLAISAVDVNRDGSPDLVVEDPFSLRRVFIWINDGHGAFHSASVDDFQADEDESCPFVATPCHGPQCPAIDTPGKMRSPGTSSEWRRMPAATSDFQFVAALDRAIPTWDTKPNPLRGPPLRASL